MNEEWCKFEFVMDNMFNEYVGFESPTIIYINMTQNITPNLLIFDVESDDKTDKIENIEIDFEKVTKSNEWEEDNDNFICETNPNFQLKQYYFGFDKLQQELNLVFPNFKQKPEIEIVTTRNIIIKKFYFDISNEDKTYVITNICLRPTI